MTVAVVIDSSGSMEGPPLDALASGLERLASGMLERDKLAGVSFGTGASVAWTARPVADRSAREAALRRLRAGGSEDPVNGIRLALNLLRTPAREPEIRRLVLVTDWRSPHRRAEGPDALAPVLADLRDEGIAVTAVGLGPDFDEGVLVRIAEATGGVYVPVENPRDLPDALQAFAYHCANAALTGVRVQVAPVGRTVANGGSVTLALPLPDIAWGEERRLLVPLRHGPRRPGQYVVASVSASWTDATCGERRTHRHDAMVDFGAPDADEADGEVRTTLAGRAAVAVVRSAMEAYGGGRRSAVPVEAQLAVASDALRTAGFGRLSERVDTVLDDLTAGRIREPNKTLAAVVIEGSAGTASALF